MKKDIKDVVAGDRIQLENGRFAKVESVSKCSMMRGTRMLNLKGVSPNWACVPFGTEVTVL